MTVIAFDTLAYSNKLKEGGMEARLADVQAEETAKILNDLATNQLATKQDLNLLKNDLVLVKNDLTLIKSDLIILKNDFLGLKNDFLTLKTDVLKEIHLNTWKIVGLIAGLQALFHFIK